jgi:CheY-like chemotaxis protein
MLEKLGYRVFTAMKGQEAIEMYRRRSAEINLVILDMIMPEMGGKEVFSKLKRINSNLKVLFSSGYSEDFQSDDIINDVNTSFIQKPFSILVLSKKIKQILENQSEDLALPWQF